MNDSIVLLGISLGVVFFINVGYRVLVNQARAKEARARMNELSKEMRAAHKSGDRERANRLFAESMQQNNAIMKMSLKPMLASFVIVIAILPLVGNLYGDKAVALSDGKGVLKAGDKEYEVTRSGSSITVGDAQCTLPCSRVALGGSRWNIAAEGESLAFVRVVAYLPVSLPLFGNDVGWLGWYLFASIPTMILTRRLLKIHL